MSTYVTPTPLDTRQLRIVKPLIRTAFPEYRGRTVFVVVEEKIKLTNVNWDGGTRYEYVFLRGDGAVNRPPTGEAVPWANPYSGLEIPLSDNVLAVVYHSVGGKGSVYIHLHPSLLPKWLPTGGAV